MNSDQLVVQNTNAAGVYPANYTGDVWYAPLSWQPNYFTVPVTRVYTWPWSGCRGHCYCIEMTPPRSKKPHEECCKCSDRRLAEES